MKFCANTCRPAAQRGIGLVGFIFGLVVGMAVALGVAVYITRIPTPFTDKGAVKSAEQQAAEAERDRAWNPNASLAGNRPTVAGGAVQEPPAAGEPPIVTQTDTPASPDTAAHEVLADREQELAKARLEAEAKRKADLAAQEQARLEAEKANAAADPIAALLQQRQAAQTGTAPSSEGFVYFVQAGAFRNETDADAQKARLTMLGFNARISERDQAGRPVHRVRMGPFASKAEADSVKAQLESSGIDTALVRMQR